MIKETSDDQAAPQFMTVKFGLGALTGLPSHDGIRRKQAQSARREDPTAGLITEGDPRSGGGLSEISSTALSTDTPPLLPLSLCR
jgi:hypothetical protein